MCGYYVQFDKYTYYTLSGVCLCCVCYHSIYSEHQTCGRTSRGHTGGRSHRIFHIISAVLAFLFYREKDSAVPFPRRSWSRILSTHELIVLHSLGMIFLFLFVRKNSSSCDCTEIQNHVLKSEGFEVTIWTTGETGLFSFSESELQATEKNVWCTVHSTKSPKWLKTFLQLLGGLHEEARLCNALQVMAPSNLRKVHQNSLLHVESNLYRLGLVSPFHGQPSMDQPGKVAIPARGQLDTTKWIFPCARSRLRVWYRVTSSALPSSVSLLTLHTQAESVHDARKKRHPQRKKKRNKTHEDIRRYSQHAHFIDWLIDLMNSHIISWCQKSGPWSQGRKTQFGRKQRTTVKVIVLLHTKIKR